MIPVLTAAMFVGSAPLKAESIHAHHSQLTTTLIQSPNIKNSSMRGNESGASRKSEYSSPAVHQVVERHFGSPDASKSAKESGEFSVTHLGLSESFKTEQRMAAPKQLNSEPPYSGNSYQDRDQTENHTNYKMKYTPPCELIPITKYGSGHEYCPPPNYHEHYPCDDDHHKCYGPHPVPLPGTFVMSSILFGLVSAMRTCSRRRV